jgi:hypothetical protein
MINHEIESQREELRRAKERVAEEEKKSRAVHEELVMIKRNKNRVKECITLSKNHRNILPTKVTVW